MAHLRDISHDEPSQSPLPRKAPNIRVLIADEDPRVRHALRALIESEPDVVVVGEAWSVDDVVDSCSHLRPSVVLLDPVMTRLDDGLRLVRFLTQIERHAVVAISLRGCLRDAVLAAGASAFIEKGAAPEALLAALHSAGHGRHLRLLT